jgi:hypothetical protein
MRNMFAKEKKEDEEIVNYFLSFLFPAINKIFKRIILI